MGKRLVGHEKVTVDGQERSSPVYQLSRAESKTKALRKALRFDIQAGERADDKLRKLRESCPHRVQNNQDLQAGAQVWIRTFCVVCDATILTTVREPT